MGKQSVRHIDLALTQVADGAFEIDGVPQDDGRHDEVETGGTVPLVFEGAVAQFTEPVEKDGTGECVSRLALVEVRVGASAKDRIVEPVEHEQRTLDAPDLA